MFNQSIFLLFNTRWQWLAPMIKADYAAKRIMDAILTNQHILMMTRQMYGINICHAWVHFYTVPNLTLVDKKLTYFYQYQRYFHKCGKIVLNVKCAIIWAYYLLAPFTVLQFYSFFTISHRVAAYSADHFKNK